MMLYGTSLYVLEEEIQGEYSGFLLSWYADDFRTTGAGAHLKIAMYRIEALGPVCGLFIEPDNP